MSARRTSSRTPQKAHEWLKAFEQEGTVTAACRASGIPRRTVYDWRQAHEDFALAWADIEEATTEAMEREAYRRAVEGTTEPLVSAGKHVTDVKKYSDTLLIFMLKSRRPEKYRDNVRVEHTGQVKTDLQVVGVEDAAGRREALRLLADALDDSE